MSNSIRIRHIREQVLFSIRKSLKAWDWRLQIHFPLSCIQSNADLEQLYPATFWCMWKSYYLWILPRKSYETHMTNLETHVFIHTWWTQMKIIKNTTIFWVSMKNTTTFWCSSYDQNVYPEFQVKACGAQDTLHNTIRHPTTAIWAQNSINRDQRSSITCTIAKHTRKHVKRVWSSCNLNWSSLKTLFIFFAV